MIPFALIGVAGQVIFSQVALSLYNLTLKRGDNFCYSLMREQICCTPLRANFELIKQIWRTKKRSFIIWTSCFSILSVLSALSVLSILSVFSEPTFKNCVPNSSAKNFSQETLGETYTLLSIIISPRYWSKMSISLFILYLSSCSIKYCR